MTGAPVTRTLIALVATLIGLVVAGPAAAHLERPSYWPDPAPDRSVSPPAGGKVPTARSLASAVTGAGPGDVHVVCQGQRGARSLALVRRSLRSARARGYVLRPSQPRVRVGRAQARRLLEINRRLAGRCRFGDVQSAINRSDNNDRVVIMPGRYTEPRSRRAPTNDPRCNPGLLQRDASGDPTPSYEYQVTCPNDQNLVYVQGRAVVGDPLPVPRSDRRGIPEQELGPCVRCNLQVEGSGVAPTDVIIDAGEDYEGRGPEARPSGHAKHVVLRADRTDGFVGRNFTLRGALEHGFYTEESDGVLLDRVKFFWNADYGHLAFTSDHQEVRNCDGMGAGDAAIYPGATPDTGSQATSFYPDAPRKNTLITRCDMRNSALGYSGSMGNAVRISRNHIYGNTTGIASDTLSSAGHPGFPADSVEVDHNLIYSNNFDTYAKDSPVDALVTVPIGTGIIFAGMNDARIHHNWFFDNRRFGTMLFAVPDALTSFGGPEGDVFPGVSCPGAPQNGISTSCGNRYFRNRMGQVPRGFEFPAVLRRYGVPHGRDGARRLRNGTDFWWDEWLGNTGNCWFDNRGPDGTAASITGPGGAGSAPGTPPHVLPDCASGRRPALSVGPGDAAKLGYLLACSEGPPATTSVPEERGEETPTPGCDWYTPPPRPGTRAARRAARTAASAARAFERGAEGARLRRRMQELNAGIEPQLPLGGAAPATGAQPVGTSSAGSVAQFADCGDWRGASRAARLATIRDIRGQLTPQRSTTAASPLSDERAYGVFERACTQERFSSLRLYKLYARVQGFAPLAE